MRTSAFGLSLRFEGGPPPGAWARHVGRGPELTVREAPEAVIAGAWSGGDSLGWEAQIDGLPFRVEKGVRADHLFLHGERTIGHLDAEGSTLLHDAAGGDGIGGWRVVLDSVLFSAALLSGIEALHAGAVVGEGGAIAVAAASGGGKSTLLTALMAAGLELLADDVVTLGTESQAVLANPGPPLMTAPAAAPSLPGRELASIGEERWLATPVCSQPQPLAAVVLLNRRAVEGTGLRPLATPLVPLLTMMLRFPRIPDRERSRFELAAAIAERVPIWELRAGPAVEPAALAELLLEGEPQARPDHL